MVSGYIRSRVSVFIMYLCALIGFPVLCRVKTGSFDAALNDTLYGVIFITLVLLVWLIIDSGKYFKKHLALERMLKELDISSRRVPATNELIEQDYCELMKKLYGFVDTTLESATAQNAATQQYFLRWLQKSYMCFNTVRKSIEAGEPAPKKELAFAEHYLRGGIQYIKAEPTAKSVVKERCSVDEIVRVSVQRLNPLFLERKISVGMKRIGLEAVTDKSALCFIVDELLLNALYNTESGSVRIYSAAGADGNPQLIIEDTGTSIPHENVVYFSSCGSLYKSEEAQGLGLFTVRRVADAIGVSVTYATDNENGTAAKISLP